MKKSAWRNCRKTFLEAIFSHSRKLFSKFRAKFSSSFYVISSTSKISCCLSANHNPELRCVICTGVTLFALCYTWTALLSANQNRVIFSCLLLGLQHWSVMKMEVFENALQTAGIWKRQLCVFVWMENILKTEPFGNDDVTIIMWFPWPSFPQTQIQNDRWLLRFKFLRRCVNGKHFMRFQSWNAVFKFLRRKFGRGLVSISVDFLKVLSSNISIVSFSVGKDSSHLQRGKFYRWIFPPVT